MRILIEQKTKKGKGGKTDRQKQSEKNRSLHIAWDEISRNAMKSVLSFYSGPVGLGFFDPDKMLRIDCDGSHIGRAAAAFQKIDNSEEIFQPLEFWSETAKGSEQLYPAGKIETLALRNALQAFRHMTLVSKEKEIHTDHSNLKFTINQAPTCDFMLRLYADMTPYTPFAIKLVKGVKMGFVDGLNRTYMDRTIRRVFCSTRISRTVPIRTETIGPTGFDRSDVAYSHRSTGRKDHAQFHRSYC
jgi:hypothetical protein